MVITAKDLLQESKVLNILYTEDESMLRETTNMTLTKPFKSVHTAVDGRDDKNVIIIIHGYGDGVSETIREKIFDPYFATKHESVGIGIGLYMSRK